MPLAFVPYSDQNTELEAFIAHPDDGMRPLVILCHGWKGRDDYICEKAKELSQLGYVGFALDMYGKGVLGKSKEENAALKKPFLEDRHLLHRRVHKAFEVATSLPYVDKSRVAVLGLGFGGVCALDLARSGAPLKGAISIYGHFEPPPPQLIKQIHAKILILHGYKDPVVPPQEVHAFEKELSAAHVHWETHLYGDALHGFFSPSAHDPKAGIQYHPLSAQRAWISVKNFLSEVLTASE